MAIKFYESLWVDLKSSVLKSMSLAYTGDGIDHTKRTLNGSTAAYGTDNGAIFIQDPTTMISGFFGLPNRRRDHSSQSWRNIGLNFIHYHQDASVARNIFNGIVFTILHLIAMPFKLLLNVARIATEVIPGALAFFALKLGYGVYEDGKDSFNALGNSDINWAARIGLGFGYSLMMLVGLAVSLTGYGLFAATMIGKCLTSPIQIMRGAWHIGADLGGYVGGIIFAAAALSAIAISWGIALPLLAGLVVPFVPAIVESLPTAVLSVINSVALATLPALNAVGTAIMPAIVFAANALTFGLVDMAVMMSAMTPIVALGALFGSALALFGPPIDKLVRNKENTHHQIRPRSPHAGQIHHADELDNLSGSRPGNTLALTRAMQQTAGVELAETSVATPEDKLRSADTSENGAATESRTQSSDNVLDFQRRGGRSSTQFLAEPVGMGPPPPPPAEEASSRVCFGSSHTG